MTRVGRCLLRAYTPVLPAAYILLVEAAAVDVSGYQSQRGMYLGFRQQAGLFLFWAVAVVGGLLQEVFGAFVVLGARHRHAVDSTVPTAAMASGLEIRGADRLPVPEAFGAVLDDQGYSVDGDLAARYFLA